MTAAATQAGVILGTAAYMSPEQSRGREADRRTDVWAFGCVLYEMLAGRGVFHGPTASDCIAGILEREPDWEALPPGTPSAIRKLLRRCLEKDARRRLHDIADVRIEMEEANAGAGTAEETETPEAPTADGKGARITWAVAGLLLGVLATALVVSRWMPLETASHRSPGRFAVSLPPEAPVIPSAEDASVAISPDGTRLVYVGPEAGTAGPQALGSARRSGSTRQTQLFTRRMDDYEVRAVDGTIGARSPFFSPDGEWVGFFDTNDTRLKKIRLRGGVPVSLCEGALRAGHWAEDGRIYFTGDGDGIQAVSEDGGTPETLTMPERERGEKTRRFPHALLGGRALLFTLGSSTLSSYADAGVALLDLESGEHRILLEGGTFPSYVPTGHILYARSGSLEAVPFDLESMQISGAPFTVVDDVVTSDGWGEAQYTVSKSGKLAYVPGGPEIYRYDVYWLDREGHVEVVPLPPAEYFKVSFSPEGRRLVLSSLGANANIWVYEIERRTMTRLTTEGDNVNPLWMRNGNYVTYNAAWPGPHSLWRVAVDGSGSPELVHEFEQPGFTGSWSVGDEQLLFTSNRPGTGLDLWLLTPGEEPKTEPLLQTAFQETDPVLSPDGQWLAYTSDTTGRTELYVQRFPVAGRKWQISVGGGEHALGSPDGRELYYWKGSRLMAVSVTTEPDFVPGKERELPQPEFDVLLNWDIAPDGSRFVVVGRAATESPPTTAPRRATGSSRVEASVPEIHVVVDWFEELRRGP
jgi:serine/threonine-protein kinase